MRPLGNRIVIERDKSKDQTPGGLYVPEAAKSKAQRGTVLAVGTGRSLSSGSRQALELQVGDVVYFEKYGGVELVENDRPVVILQEDDILAIVEAS